MLDSSAGPDESKRSRVDWKSVVVFYVLIGVLWEAWHFTNRIHGREISEVFCGLAISYPSAIALSAVLGEGADRTRSLVVAVALHFWVDALFDIPSLFNGAPTVTYTVFGAAIGSLGRSSLELALTSTCLRNGLLNGTDTKPGTSLTTIGYPSDHPH
jgi:hypothetical protein